MLRVTSHPDIKPSISFKERKPPTGEIGAIYIKDLHELVDLESQAHERVDQAEIKSIIVNINQTFSQNKKLTFFIDIPLDEYKNVITLSKKYINSDKNYIEEQLKFQEEDAYNDISIFAADCKSTNTTTIAIGGVYGRGCVFDMARRMGDNIYTKQLGDHHPNVRFYHDEAMFKNIIILPNITQGYFETDRKFTFDEFLLFKPTIVFLLTEEEADQSQINQVMKEMLSKYSTAGKFYEDNYREDNNPDNHSSLFQSIVTIINQSNVVTPRVSSSSIFSSPTPDTTSTKSILSSDKDKKKDSSKRKDKSTPDSGVKNKFPDDESVSEKDKSKHRKKKK